MGGGKKPSVPPPDPYAAQAASQSNLLFQQTDPLRQQWLDYGKKILSGEPITSIPLYGSLFDASKTGIESQFKNARENILERVPVGGSMYQGLSDVEIARAKELAKIPYSIQAPITQDFLDKVYGIVSGAPQTSISGLNTAAGVEANRYASNANYGAQKGAGTMGMLGALGQGAGSLYGNSLIAKSLKA